MLSTCREAPSPSPTVPRARRLTAAEGGATVILHLGADQLLSQPTCRGALGARACIADCGRVRELPGCPCPPPPATVVPRVTLPHAGPEKSFPQESVALCGPSGPRCVTSLVFPKTLPGTRDARGHQLHFRWRSKELRGPTSGPASARPRDPEALLPCRPGGRSQTPCHPLPTGVQASPHRFSMQHGLSARGLLTATKPARPHCCGWSGARHSTGVHCTDTVPLSHTQSWQLLTHRSPGCNRPGQGPPGLLGGALASGVASSSRSGPGLPVPGAALRLTWLTPGCAIPTPAPPPDPGQSRGPGRGTPALLPLKRGVRLLKVEHSRIWEAHPVPHRLRGKNGEKGVSGSTGVGAQPAWPPLPQWRPLLPAWGRSPWRA